MVVFNTCLKLRIFRQTPQTLYRVRRIRMIIRIATDTSPAYIEGLLGIVVVQLIIMDNKKYNKTVFVEATLSN